MNWFYCVATAPQNSFSAVSLNLVQDIKQTNVNNNLVSEDSLAVDMKKTLRFFLVHWLAVQ